MYHELIIVLDFHGLEGHVMHLQIRSLPDITLTLPLFQLDLVLIRPLLWAANVFREHHRSLFSTKVLSTGGLIMVKLEIDMQLTLKVWVLPSQQ